MFEGFYHADSYMLQVLWKPPFFVTLNTLATKCTNYIAGKLQTTKIVQYFNLYGFQDLQTNPYCIGQELSQSRLCYMVNFQ